MYKIVSVERVGDSVFKSEYDTNDINDARAKYNEEKKKLYVVDVRMWYCTELERFVRHKPKKKNIQYFYL